MPDLTRGISCAVWGCSQNNSRHGNDGCGNWHSFFTDYLPASKLGKRGDLFNWGHKWLQGKSEIRFKRVMKALLDYSLIESCQDSESYSMHPVVHDWCAETIGDGKDNLVIAALTIVGTAAPDHSEAEYWVSQQRLLAHANWLEWTLTISTF